jgi:hypothetical protein
MIQNFFLTRFSECLTWRNAIGEIAPAGIRRAGFCFAATPPEL